jgi:two-component system NtrC family sensor kinase
MTVPDLLSPEERPRYIAEMRSGRIFNPKGKNWRCQAKDGRLLTTEVERHRFDFAGRSCILGFTQDVTQREQLEMELRQHQKLEAVGSLAAGVAHEINTPIQFVGDNLRFLQDAFESLHRVVEKSGQLRKAADTGSVPPELAAEFDATTQTADIEYLTAEIPKAIHQSIEGAGRVATIVRAMKNFAHPDSGEMMNANLNEALTSTLTIARNELKYVADVEEDFGELPLVRCSLGDLNQVFLNLLVNAAHAIHEVVKDSGKKGKIRVATSAQPDWVQITIADSGCGIPKEFQDKVFDPFFTTKGVGRGTGQGLAIARAIVVEKHHGTLTFTTQEGEGTTFVMRLPHDQGSEVASSEDAASHE